MALGYVNTLIAIADDCPTATSQVPPVSKGKKTVANLHYELLSERPFVHTQEDVLFESWLRRQETPPATEAEAASLREVFFSKPKACLRTSPLSKRYGWGLLFDGQGRISLCPVESTDYQEIVSGKVPGIKVVKAIRSKRSDS